MSNEDKLRRALERCKLVATVKGLTQIGLENALKQVVTLADEALAATKEPDKCVRCG